MRKFFLLAALAIVGAVHANNALPPVQYIAGAPACPSDLDIKNIETRLSARVVPPDNAGSLHQEKAKAMTCRTAGGRYSQDDWKRMKAVTRGDQ